jgi:flagellar biogenesis protein FliO
VLAPAWSWLKRKYPVAAEKRMRLAENIPLGEKRFVALVTVGNREFLIGGAASNVSLLSQWESTANSPASGKQTLVMRESFE